MSIESILINGLWCFVAAGLSGGCGLLVVVIAESVFENIVKHPRTTGDLSESQLKREIEKIEDPELRYGLQRLLDEKRIGWWWKFLCWLVVSGIVFYSLW